MSEVIWQAESLRATAFYTSGNAPSDIARLWQLLMHRQPDEVSSRPNERLQLARGPFGGSERQLQCAMRPERVDWVLAAVPPVQNRAPEGLPTIDSLTGVLPSFRDLAVRWLEISPAMSRLAFGGVLLLDVSSVSEANSTLASFLPSVSLDPDRVSDFLYRVNRRQALASREGVLANRLGTWSTIQVGSVGVSVSGDGSALLTQEAGHFACRLELDINTVAPSAFSFSGAEATAVFEELVALAVEISEQGDRP